MTNQLRAFLAAFVLAVGVMVSGHTEVGQFGEGSFQLTGGNSSGGTISNSATNYFPINGFLPASLTEVDVLVGTEPITPSKFACATIGGSPGAGKSYTFVIRNGGADTDWSCAIADAATTCSDETGSAIAASSQTIAVKSVPSGTPTAVRAVCRLVAALTS